MSTAHTRISLPILLLGRFSPRSFCSSTLMIRALLPLRKGRSAPRRDDIPVSWPPLLFQPFPSDFFLARWRRVVTAVWLIPSRDAVSRVEKPS